MSKQRAGGDLFIVDNSDQDWKVFRYLKEWAEFSSGLDVATAYFEIGGLLALGDCWRGIDQIRILMGDEVSRRTKAAFEEALAGIKSRLDGSLEAEKEKDDFLEGVPAIVDALMSGRIACRVYRKDKFHAKAYITHARKEVLGTAALVGSSNFTRPGLCNNVELNIQVTGAPVTALQAWYEKHWNEAEDVTPDILRVVERHVREYTPFEVYAQSLHYLFRDAPSTASEWEEKPVELGGSRVFKLLDRYQQTGYRNMIQIADRFGGAFLCDGVGLGKTFIGMMLLERLVRFEKKRVVLIVPKSGRKAVWESSLAQYCPELLRQAFLNLRVINHTDITRQTSADVDWPALMDEIQKEADAVLIDEAHHFRNPGVQVDVEPASGKLVAREGKRPSRYRRLYHMLESPNGPKKVYLLTATPVNNHINDLRHMIELFTRRDDKHFADKLGINSLRGHFRRLENHIEKQMLARYGNAEGQVSLAEAEEVLEKDPLFEAIVVQRSRVYVRKSQEQEGGAATVFPTREPPRVANYNVRKTYGKLLDMVETAFRRDKPLFRLGIYYPYAYALEEAETPEQKIEENRQKQVVGLVRTNFLKRFESSAKAFEASCERLFLKLLAWARVHAETTHEKDRLAKIELKYEKVIGQVAEHVRQIDRHQIALFDGDPESAEEDVISPEMIENVEEIDRKQFDVPAILNDTIDDLDQIAEFLEELQRFEPKHDDKLLELIRMLQKDKVLREHKVLVFTEFADTARYLVEHLKTAGIPGVERIDGSTSPDTRLDMIHRFSPYYNGDTSERLANRGKQEIRILVSTDVLSEGLNLQDATRLINYDLHWNPVRLMQRIGRVDRRLNPAVEQRLLADHPDQKSLRGQITFWNFLPPDDLERLLALYQRVAHKTLRISRVFGIEGQKLLTPEDDYEALKNFNEKYEGVESAREKLRLDYERLLTDHPALAARLDALPGRVFSARELDRAIADRAGVGTRAVFFCYALPGRDAGVAAEAPLFEQWTEAAGDVRWYLLDLDSGKVLEEPTAIAPLVSSEPDTPRRVKIERPLLADARATVEKHINKTYLRAVDAPARVNARLVAWMELN